MNEIKIKKTELEESLKIKFNVSMYRDFVEDNLGLYRVEVLKATCKCCEAKYIVKEYSSEEIKETLKVFEAYVSEDLKGGDTYKISANSRIKQITDDYYLLKVGEIRIGIMEELLDLIYDLWENDILEDYLYLKFK